MKHSKHPDMLESQSCHTCLVIPEGLDTECNILSDFSIKCARVCPEVRFIWRLHPLVNWKYLSARNAKLKTLPKNIVLSQLTLDEDIGRCNWALYRGTTAIVQAVMAGLRPIYLQLPEELTVDPLYELKYRRINVTNVS